MSPQQLDDNKRIHIRTDILKCVGLFFSFASVILQLKVLASRSFKIRFYSTQLLFLVISGYVCLRAISSLSTQNVCLFLLESPQL